MGNKLKLNPSIHYCKQVCITNQPKIYTPHKPMKLMFVQNVILMRGGNTSHLKFQNKLKILTYFFQRAYHNNFTRYTMKVNIKIVI